MTSKTITKAIYELNAVESEIVNNAVKLLIKHTFFSTHIKSIKTIFSLYDYHNLLKEYTTERIDEIHVETDTGLYKILLISDYLTRNRFSRYLKVDGNKNFDGMQPVIQYFACSNGLKSKNYHFLLKWIMPKKPNLFQRFKMFVLAKFKIA